MREKIIVGKSVGIVEGLPRREGDDVLENVLGEITKRIADAIHPQKIILFGSAARGAMTEDSDLDLLVIAQDGTHRRRASQSIYKALRGIGLAKDIVVVTEADVEAYGSDPSLILKTALADGREIYHAEK
ncbi:MAG: nucleotidyltransferase domain-containing protein [Nitrospinae bacterium]|nr:nucleotidyltransferase domain-containing protein [Nitrospinota bacterium]MBF0635309.1 nucleotidyltransferase domain-containing protein [Nitrospinota bacterium]